MELILIRHGLPEKVIRSDGGAADPNLSEQGHRQAAQVADYLKDEQIHRLYSSPMRRAVQTAEPISKTLDLLIEKTEITPLIRCNLLRRMTFVFYDKPCWHEA